MYSKFKTVIRRHGEVTDSKVWSRSPTIARQGNDGQGEAGVSVEIKIARKAWVSREGVAKRNEGVEGWFIYFTSWAPHIDCPHVSHWYLRVSYGLQQASTSTS